MNPIVRPVPALGAAALVVLLATAPTGAVAQQPRFSNQPPHPGPEIQDRYLPWPLPPGAQQYADIDGRRMLQHVAEQAEISRRYRDQVHPKFWGRIIGTSADAESAEWLANHFRRIGLSDVRIQNFDLDPQWFPGEYSVVARSGGETLELA